MGEREGAVSGLPELPEILREFLNEAREILGDLEAGLVRLEQGADVGALDAVFRGLHNLKGTAGLLGFGRLEELAHAGEDLLGALRAGEQALSPAHVTALLAALDRMRALLLAVEETGSDGEGAVEVDACLSLLRGVLADPEQAPAAPPAELALGAGPAQGPERTIRTDVELLDSLMDQVSELVLARNLIHELAERRRDPELSAASARLGGITSGIQENVARTRMRPLEGLWSRFPRLLRDLALQQGKQVRLLSEGGDTELDRGVLEAISDPVSHLVRNAVDHGLEPVEERRAAGKPAEGTLQLRAHQEGGYVYVVVQDDGRGIDPERIAVRARASGLLSAEASERASKVELLQLIFEPGFSTADEVTSLSGRGVGMDVVRSHVERIGGSVEIASEVGLGTTVKLRIPLTLAIIPALLVRCGEQRFAIPQTNVQELVGLSGGGAALERFGEALTYRLRERLLPAIDLGAQLGLAPCALGRESSLVVVQAEGRPVGIMVDAVGDHEEIVVKPLPRHLRALPSYSGATILGDGDVILILDVVGASRQAELLRTARRAPLSASPRPARAEDETLDLLLFESEVRGRYGIPLGSASRLEELPREVVERSGAQLVAQRRGEILPLLHFDALWSASPASLTRLPELLQVLVCATEAGPVGLIVDRIVDVVQATLEVTGASDEPCVDRRAVVDGRVTQILDVARLSEALSGRARAALPAPALGGSPD